MLVEFELADKTFCETRSKHRVEAISKARLKLKKLEREIESVKSDIEKAKGGDFLTLVEKYISPQIAEEFE